MAFRVLDRLSLPGDAAGVNEDAFAQDTRAALVMDGATPLGSQLLPGPSDAAWIANFGARRLMAHLQDGDTPPQALAHALADTQKSFAGLARRAPKEKWEMPCAAMMLVVDSDPLGPSHGQDSNFDFLWYGDCGALVWDGKSCDIIGEGFSKRSAEAARARMIGREGKLSPTDALRQPALLAHLRAGRGRINRGGNWLFTPDSRAAAHVARTARKLAPGAQLLIASDGFLALAGDYGAYDAEALVAAAKAKGLAALGAELRAIEEADEAGEKFPRFKKSDDATALLLEVV